MNKAFEIADRRGPIRIRLTTGDALSCVADLAVIGSGPDLIRRVELESGSRFSALEYPEWMRNKYGFCLNNGFALARLLSAPEFTWKNVLSMTSRPTASPRAKFQAEFLDAMVVTIRHTIRPKKLLFLPYNASPADVVVLNTLCIIYFIMRHPLGKRTFYRPPELEIVDLGNAAMFADAVRGHKVANFKEFLKRQASKHWWLSDEELEEYPPSFEFIS